MMKKKIRVGITLNEVLRDFAGQFHYVFEKYLGGKENLDEELLDDFDLCKKYEFDDKASFNRFLYKQASLEIFGHADQMRENVMLNFNNFIMDLEDEESDIEIILISREVGPSIPSTFFFLSKLLCKAPSIKFVKEYEDKWEHVDVLVTANPIALDSKPANKKSIKIKYPYNEKCESDFEFETIEEIMDVDKITETIK